MARKPSPPLVRPPESTAQCANRLLGESSPRRAPKDGLSGRRKVDSYRTPLYESVHSVASLRLLSDINRNDCPTSFGMSVRLRRNAHAFGSFTLFAPPCQ